MAVSNWIKTSWINSYFHYILLLVQYRVSREENQFSVIGYQFIKISVIASTDLSERGNFFIKLKT
jgi:hypothetical protein